MKIPGISTGFIIIFVFNFTVHILRVLTHPMCTVKIFHLKNANYALAQFLQQKRPILKSPVFFVLLFKN